MPRDPLRYAQQDAAAHSARSQTGSPRRWGYLPPWTINQPEAQAMPDALAGPVNLPQVLGHA